MSSNLAPFRELLSSARPLLQHRSSTGINRIDAWDQWGDDFDSKLENTGLMSNDRPPLSQKTHATSLTIVEGMSGNRRKERESKNRVGERPTLYQLIDTTLILRWYQKVLRIPLDVRWVCLPVPGGQKPNSHPYFDFKPDFKKGNSDFNQGFQIWD